MEWLNEFIHIRGMFTYIRMAIVIFSVLYIMANTDRKYVKFPNDAFSLFVAFIVVWWIAELPVHFDTPGDREHYANSVRNAINLPVPEFSVDGDYLFKSYTYWSGHIMTYKTWFWLTAAMYVMNYFFAAKRLLRDNAYVMFLLVICSFSFLAYGANTMRAGLASSFLILAMSFFDKPKIGVAFIVISIGIHFSMIIPASAMVAAFYYNNTKVYIWGWIACFVLSYVFGNYFEDFFSQFDLAERSQGYLLTENKMYKTGFRWDFLLYGLAPILLGLFYINSWNYKSKKYSFILNTYIIANAVWVLVIRANFTDRIAYLSWMFMPFVLIYPMLEKKINSDLLIQGFNIILVIICVFGFTTYMG